MQDEKQGYGLRLRGLDSDEECHPGPEKSARRRFIPSVRTVATLSFVAMFVSLCLAIYFSTEHNRTQVSKTTQCSLFFYGVDLRTHMSTYLSVLVQPFVHAIRLLSQICLDEQIQ